MVRDGYYHGMGGEANWSGPAYSLEGVHHFEGCHLLLVEVIESREI